jgi:hypoxanthine-DNA glycosylase
MGSVMSVDTHTLILCSYPGKEPFESREYYADTQNQFWLLMSAVLGISLCDMSYEKRLDALLLNGIGLWDVVSACQSEKPLNRLFHENRPERFAFLRDNFPFLRRIAFNGQPAGEYAPLFEQAGYLSLILPSSSLRWSKQPLEKKLETWRHLL